MSHEHRSTGQDPEEKKELSQKRIRGKKVQVIPLLMWYYWRGK
jgi:hypothetical protein